MVSIAKPIDLTRFRGVKDGAKTVSAISIIGIPTYPEKFHPLNGTHLVHWRVHLRWTGRGCEIAEGSVVLDTERSSITDPIVTISVVSRSSIVSRYGSKHWEFRVPVIQANLSVQTVVDLITARGRDRYQYDGNGSGCLSWSTKLLTDYVAAEYVHAQAIPDFAEFIAKTRKAEASFHWIPDDQGTYI